MESESLHSARLFLRSITYNGPTQGWRVICVLPSISLFIKFDYQKIIRVIKFRMTSLGEVYDASQGNIMGLAVLRDDYGLITVSHDR